MLEKNNWKAWLYLLPAMLFLGFFMLYPLIDVVVYSFEENYNFVSQKFTGIGFENYFYVLSDGEFVKAIVNTFLIVIITVPLSTIIALLISAGLNAIKPLRKVFQTIFFLPYVTNALAVGLVFMILFDITPYSTGFVNNVLGIFGINAVDWIEGPYWAKMFVLCFYVIWNVMPFKILVLVGALQSVNKTHYQAAAIDGTPKWRVFTRITVPLISPMISYLVITGFIGAFKEYTNAVALFGTDLRDAGMNTIVGYVYDTLYSATGGYPSYASAAAIILLLIVMTITAINLLVSEKHVHY
jgi:multiple sugar transport system permease protein